MQFFKKKQKPSGRVGLVINPHTLALAHLEERDGDPCLVHCRQMTLQSEKESARALASLVKEFDLEGEPCSYVLNPADYNLHLVEAPNVEDSELRAAVRWQIKDLLDMKVEDAAIDVFRVPQDAYRGRNMLYVVASLKSCIRSIVDRVNASGLQLAVIDIPELAMQNLSRRFIHDEHGVAFMDLRRTGSTMNITCHGDLYLTRRINTQLDPDAMQSPEWDILKDRLVLEIQRSLDYYESQMGRGQITQIVIAAQQHDTADLAKALDGLLSAQVSSLDIEDKLDSDVELASETQHICMVAIGATLRDSGLRGKPGQPEPGKQKAA
jgi:MSHA biogenesis protein MshI